MNTAAKSLKAMANNPAADWSLTDIQNVARRHGVSWDHKGGSHCVFRWPDGRTLAVPARRPIKPLYIRQFVSHIGSGE